MNASEYCERLARARSRMAQTGIDALLLASGPNLFYFTGLPHGRSGSRPYLLIIPTNDEARLIVHEARSYEARRFSHVSEIRTYAGLSQVPMAELAAEMARLSLRRVGMEIGGEHYLDLQVSDMMRLRAAHPEVDFIDVADLLWSLRKVKSPGEVAAITEACRITGEAYEQTFARIRVGMTEAQIETLMLTAMLEGGGSSPWALITSGPGNYDLVSKGGGDRRVAQGDMVWMDAGCAISGYNADFSRAGVIGGPSDMQAAAQSQIHAITMDAVAMLQPGMAVATVAERCEDALERLDFPITSCISGLAGRVGHGLGLVVTEWPSISRESPEILESGMVVTIEPGVATEYGTFHVEENVLVTEAGPRILSECPWPLRILAT